MTALKDCSLQDFKWQGRQCDLALVVHAYQCISVGHVHIRSSGLGLRTSFDRVQ